MENFNELYDQTSFTYAKIESLMAEIYAKGDNQELLKQLGDIAKSILALQNGLTESYCTDNELQSALLVNISSKMDALENGLNKEINM